MKQLWKLIVFVKEVIVVFGMIAYVVVIGRDVLEDYRKDTLK